MELQRPHTEIPGGLPAGLHFEGVIPDALDHGCEKNWPFFTGTVVGAVLVLAAILLWIAHYFVFRVRRASARTVKKAGIPDAKIAVAPVVAPAPVVTSVPIARTAPVTPAPITVRVQETAATDNIV
jgi:hypothetical protein